MAAHPVECAHAQVSSQDEDSEFTLASDFEIGHFFRERIVPRAVLYFTGEAIEDDDNVGATGAPGATSGGQGGPERWLGNAAGLPVTNLTRVCHQPDTWCMALWCLGAVAWEEGRAREQEKQASEAARASPAL